MSSLPPLTELVSPRTLQRLQDNFAEALGISSVILNLEGRPITNGRFNSDFLSKNCEVGSLESLKAVERRKTHIFECQSGIFSFAAPIMVEGRPVGLIKGGQVRLGNPDLKLCKLRAEQLNVSFDYFLEEYLNLPLFNRDRLSAAADLLGMMASTISTMAYAGLSAEEEIQQVTYINDLLEAEVKRKTRDLELVKERYRTLIENAEDVIYTMDNEGIMTSINPAISKVIGYDPDEIVDEHFSEFIHPDDLDRIRVSFTDIITGRKVGSSGLEFRLVHKKGGDRWVQLNSRAIRNSEGQMVEIEGIFRDITGAREAMQAMELSERKYRLLFENTSKPVFLLSKDGKCLNANTALANLLGYSEISDLENCDVRQFIPEEFVDDYEKVMKGIFMSGEVEWDGAIVVLLTKEGTKIVVDVSFTKITDDLFMGVLWHQNQKRSFLAKAVAKHRQSEKLSRLLNN
jgi:PAS domain S-box-containing protein